VLAEHKCLGPAALVDGHPRGRGSGPEADRCEAAAERVGQVLAGAPANTGGDRRAVEVEGEGGERLRDRCVSRRDARRLSR
jgi:hypothetical protein